MSRGGHAARNGGTGALTIRGKIPNVVDLNIQSFLFRMSIISLVSYQEYDLPVTAIARRSVGVFVNRLVVMGL